MSGERHKPRAGIVGAIYKKELLDTLRDRRTIVTMLLVPMVSYPLLVLTMTEAASVQRESEQAKKTRIQAYTPLPEPIESALASSDDLLLVQGTIANGARAETSTPAIARAAREVLGEGADVIVTATGTAGEALAGGGTAKIALYFDETSRHGALGVERVERVLGEASRTLRAERLRELGLSPELVQPISVKRRSISTDSEVGGHLASLFLPMLILVFIAIACFYPAIDLTAGEKERGTLATLLTAPIHAGEIVLGKYLAVVSIGVIAGLLNVTVITLTLLRALAGASEALAIAFPKPTVEMVAGVLLAVLLIACLTGALMLLVATFARSFRDASNLLAPVLLVVMAPGIVTTQPSAELTPGWAAVPIGGLVLWLKAVLLGKPALESMGVVVVVTVALTVVLLALAARVFGDEEVLFSNEGKRANLGALLSDPPDPGLGTAVAFTALLFVGNYFAGLLLGDLPPLPSVVVTQVLAHVLPAVLFARWLRTKIAPSRLLPLRLSDVDRPVRSFGAAALIGVGAWLGIALPLLWVQAELLPGQDEASRAFRDALGIAGAPVWLLVGCLAIVPAVAEELAFRGVVLGLLRPRMSLAAALVIQALLFGALHGSIFRLLPTAMLGLLLGLLAVRSRSLWPGIVAHALSNAVVVGVDRWASPALMERLSGPSPIALSGVAALALALWLLHGGSRKAAS